MKLASLKIDNRQYLACLVTQLAATLPILIFVRPYIDDLGRSAKGYLNWNNDGRPLADLLTAALNNGTHLATISPLLQLLSVLVLAAAGALLARSYRICRPWLSAACSLPIAIQPYFLENLSYGFDSISMACGLLFSIVGGLVIKESPSLIALTISIPLAIGSLMLYQPAFHVIAIVAILGSVFMDCRAEDARDKYNFLGSVGITVLAYVASLAIYKYLIIDVFLEAKNMAFRSQAIGIGMHLPFALKNRIVEHWSLLSADWSGTPIGMVGVAILISYAVAIAVSSGFWRHEQLGRTAFRGIAALAVISTAYGPSLLLTRPLMEQPRMMVSLGVIFCCMLMHLLQTVSPRNYQSKARLALRAWVMALIVIFSYSLVVNAYGYAAAFHAQNEYEASVLTRLAYDVDRHAELAGSKEGVRVGFIGSAPTSLVLRNSQIRYPYLKRIVPILINGDWVWGGTKLSHITGYAINQIPLGSPVAINSLIREQAMQPLFRSPLYEGFNINNTLVIRFKSSP